ncbi:MAG: AmmeMemoRadiSam system radical SAM enzyme [Candidatus Wallbacteria bacterium HGW-Wallbacteria-1]|uniref:AmmeMemoRadiSam system radical SAM enzyme n=1 Tax=Candidatus Wallbacteria bacterium HGW-Wallbacteria-1 TaxID=2013854 RepID=A0A2N1PVI8_9BACT|nr:MAG: AmmeMemoRadiSam system radical SAM enzyme [Candidatus Wallbacteria bacterium HGW-Wallbacteria-1]
MHRAMYWEILPEGKGLRCNLCPHNCIVGEDRVGICGQRGNHKGVLYSLNYGKCCSANLDPIEKKPLYHFYPGTSILSVGTIGCNLKCQFCQNWQISQEAHPTVSVTAEQLVFKAREMGSIGVAFTYNEPTIWFEFVLECSKAIRKAGLKVVLVTNGFINPEPLEELLPWIDAMNIDLKAFDNVFYTNLCGGQLAPVLATIQRVADSPVHLEITNLMVPSKNDSKEHLKTLISWIAALKNSIPLHFSKYHPDYKLKVPETRKPQLKKARTMAMKRLDYVYVGNIQDEEMNSTFCPKCSELLISRRGYQVEVRLNGKACPECGRETNIII